MIPLRNDPQGTKVVFFATFATGIPGIPRVAAFFATFCDVDDREFRVETEVLESSPRPVRTHTIGKIAATMDNPKDG